MTRGDRIGGRKAQPSLSMGPPGGPAAPSRAVAWLATLDQDAGFGAAIRAHLEPLGVVVCAPELPLGSSRREEDVQERRKALLAATVGATAVFVVSLVTPASICELVDKHSFASKEVNSPSPSHTPRHPPQLREQGLTKSTHGQGGPAARANGPCSLRRGLSACTSGP